FESDIGEQPLSEIAVETMSLAVEIRDENIEQPVAVDIAHVRAHAGKRLSITADSNAGKQPDLFEPSFSLVVKKKIRRRIIRHVDIGPAVVIVIAENNAQSFALGTVDSRFLADIRERTIPVVAIENVGLTVINVRMAVNSRVAGVDAILVVA